MSKLKVKAVMIDLDGTLIHTAPEIATAVNLMLESLNRPLLPEEQVQSYIGEGAAALIKRCLTGHLTTEPDIDLLAKAQQLFYDAYSQIVADSQPYPRVVDALRAIKGTGVYLACITNKPAVFTEPLLQKSGLKSYFDLVVSGDTLKKKKPEPDQIFYICDKFGIAVNESLLIGDSKTDIEAARNAGCFIFTVPYGYNQGYSMQTKEVDAVINHLSDTVQHINI